MTGAFLVLLVGLVVGRSVERARRARVDHQKTRALVLALRKTALRESMAAVRTVAGVGALFLVMFVAAWRGAR